MKGFLSVKESIQHSVIVQFLEGQLSEQEACERLGLHRVSLWRKVQCYRQFGAEGLAHRLRGEPSNFAKDDALKKAVLNLYRTEYGPYGYRVAHFYQEAHGRFPQSVSYPTALRWLKQAGIVKQSRKGRKHRARRPRKEAFGEMVQMDTSIHNWLDWDKNIALIGNIDDCTNRILDAHLQLTDTTLGNMLVMKRTMERYGLPEAFYVDRAPVFKVTRTGGPGRIHQPQYKTDYETQIQRALEELGIEVIFAYSPQAKGRIERNFGTWQSRLIPELRKEGIREIPQANQYIQDIYIPKTNDRFAQDPKGVRNVFVPLLGVDLNYILAECYQFRVSNDHILSSKRARILLKILPDEYRQSYARTKVDVYKHVDGSISVMYQGRHLNYDRAN